MTGEGYPFSAPESSGESSGDSKESKKSKKKKTGEAVAAETPAESKKSEAVADRGRSLWEKLVKDDKKEATKPEKVEQPLEAEPEADPKAEKLETEEQLGEEYSAELETITPEEDAEIGRRIVAEKLEALQNDIAVFETNEDQVAQAAVIEELQRIQAELPVAEDATEAVETLEDETDDEPEVISSETTSGDYADKDEPLPFEDEADVPLTAGPSSAGATSGAGRSGSGGGTGTPPSSTPAAMPGSAGPSRGPAPTPSTPHFNRAARHNIAPTPQDNQESRPNRNLQHLLVGGIVGYLIGRRRGRIKTEKRMNVIVKKLEKQVEAKQQEIDYRVAEVERKAREAFRATAAASAVERVPAPVNEAIAARVPETTPRSEKLQNSLPSSKPERAANALASKPERFAPLPKAERVSSVAPERQPKNVELKDEDIMRISETVRVGATSLRNVYEAKLITKSGLKRLVAEHLEGRDIRRGLAREFLAKELSYERDPKLRDIPADVTMAAGGTAATATSEPTATEPSSNQQTQTSSAPSAAHYPSDRPQRPGANQISSGLLTALTILAFGLAAFAVLLSIMR
jgi:hypothetical protein